MTPLLAVTVVLSAATPPGDAGAALTVRGHGFGMGAQTELTSPFSGFSLLLTSFDTGGLTFEASVGGNIYGHGVNAVDQTSAYGVGARAYLPVHRAGRWARRASSTTFSSRGVRLSMPITR